MLSVEFDAPAFAVGTAIKGRIRVNRSMEGKPVEIKKFSLALQRSTVLLADHDSNGKWVRLWEETKTPVKVEVEPNGSDEVPFQIPLPAQLYFSSDGQTGNIKLAFINTVKVVAVTKGAFSSNLEASVVVKLTPYETAVPISEVHTHHFHKFCCFPDGNVVLEVAIPTTVLDREKRIIPFKVRTSKNTSEHKIKSVSAKLTYGMSLATSNYQMWLFNPASAEVSVDADPDSEVTLPLVLTGRTGWQSLQRDSNKPYMGAQLDVSFWFEGKKEPVVRSFDVSVV